LTTVLNGLWLLAASQNLSVLLFVKQITTLINYTVCMGDAKSLYKRYNFSIEFRLKANTKCKSRRFVTTNDPTAGKEETTTQTQTKTQSTEINPAAD
jgi:hypothetical protein